VASGDSLLVLRAHDASPPAASYAQADVVDGGSTPAEAVPVWDFDGGTSDEYVDFMCMMPAHYGGNGLTCTIVWSSSAVAGGSNGVVWGIALRRIEDDNEDINSSHSYDYNEVNPDPPSAIGEVSHDDITFTNGSDMDSVVAGDYFILRIRREASDTTNDTMSGDAELHAIYIKET
jgi:hypothetical protein